MAAPSSFDIIHDGHKAIIDDMLKRVDILYLVPTTVLPGKKGKLIHTFEERYNILNTRVYYGVVQKPDYQKIIVSDIERNFDDDCGFADTFKKIKKRYGNFAEFYIALGADSFVTLPTWQKWESIVANAHLVIYNRPGYSKDDFPKGVPYEFVNINFDCSSTKERAKIRGMTDEQFEDLLDEDWWKNGMENAL